jgi:hypothetical protein
MKTCESSELGSHCFAYRRPEATGMLAVHGRRFFQLHVVNRLYHHPPHQDDRTRKQVDELPVRVTEKVNLI